MTAHTDRIVESFITGKGNPIVAGIDIIVSQYNIVKNSVEFERFMDRLESECCNAENGINIESCGYFAQGALYMLFMNFIDVESTKRLRSICKRFMQSLPEGLYSRNYYQMLSVSHFKRGHGKAYFVCDDFAKAAMLTDVKGVTIGDIMLPSDVVIISCKCPYVFTCIIYKEEKGVAAAITTTTYNHSGAIRFDNSVLISDIKKEVFSMGIVDDRIMNSNDIVKSLRIAMNSVLYITNHGTDIVEKEHNQDLRSINKRMLKAKGSKLEQLKRRAAMLASIPVLHVGGSYVIDKRLREAAEAGHGSAVAVRFVVSGHWRRQACGKGLTERRLTWIEPHWKGPMDAPFVLNVGVLKDMNRGKELEQ